MLQNRISVIYQYNMQEYSNKTMGKIKCHHESTTLHHKGLIVIEQSSPREPYKDAMDNLLLHGKKNIWIMMVQLKISYLKL